ncbi:recombination protein F [Caballeronia sordidicola]|uniref:Recombination protein F n=1 Tax=Caballeronia sordidicola TaxID=196367 RepID=A0A158EQN3_CABSO|nr:AAA family ATPase [Caballeronia sordidicola]SAL09865.1 recombination protein F [Caballeronia sordidicola]
MKIRKLKIQNFRGIKRLEWDLPNEKTFCLIGRGDSTKTTVLEAIRCAFSPQWNHAFYDSDFHLCNTDDSIQIEIVIGDLLPEFCAEQKYGAHLRGWNTGALKLNDEPDDDDEHVLSIRLVVAKDLEPKWKVFTDRNPDGVDFKATDRAKVGAGLIGTYSEKQLTWAAGTALAKITESENLNESLVEATRAARSSLDGQRALVLKKFDAAAAKSEQVAKGLGVPVGHGYKAHLDLNAISIRIGGLTLHDGDIPLRQLGLGSKRMLLCGIQQEGLEDQHITLFDEVEYGLEPHRVARLIKHIRDDQKGQYFLTTHSPTVLRELTVEQLYVLRKEDAGVRVIAAAGNALEGLNIQGHIRSSAEAFLSRKVIVCEGATEVGFLRGMDDLWAAAGKLPFSYQGLAPVDAHGASKVKGLATGFKALHYDVMVLADGDAQDQFSDKDAADLNGKEVPVVMWADRLSIEQRAMVDLPWEQVLASTKLAKELGFPVHDQVRSKLNMQFDEDIGKWQDSAELRKAIGAAAKSSNWFKNIAYGEQWAQAIFPAFADAAFLQKEFATKLGRFRAWVDNG